MSKKAPEILPEPRVGEVIERDGRWWRIVDVMKRLTPYRHRDQHVCVEGYTLGLVEVKMSEVKMRAFLAVLLKSVSMQVVEDAIEEAEMAEAHAKVSQDPYDPALSTKSVIVQSADALAKRFLQKN